MALLFVQLGVIQQMNAVFCEFTFEVTAVVLLLLCKQR